MGAFDHLCDQSGVEWQTKSFPRPNLDQYRVTDEGHLEKGAPLDLPTRYSDDPVELFAFINQLLQDGARWAWTRYDFSGTIHTVALDPDGELREAKFEFQGGILIHTDTLRVT